MTSSPFERPLPHSTETEQSILAAMLHEKSWVEKIIEEINEDYFYHHQHRTIFNAIKTLNETNKIVDSVSVSETLSEYGNLQGVGGAQYILSLYDSLTTIHHTEHYLSVLRKYFVRRRVITQANSLIEGVMNPDTDEFMTVESFNEEIRKLSQEEKKGGFLHVSKTTPIVEERVYNPTDNGISTGYSDLDELLGGLGDSELIILAGRPSSGKTTFALNIARNVALQGGHVAIVSLEMPREQLVAKFVDSIGHKNYLEHVRRNQFTHTEKVHFDSAVRRVESLNISIDDTGGLDVNQIAVRLRRLHEKEKLDLIVIDYLQLIRCSSFRESRVNQITEISNRLKVIAKGLKVPTIALAQLSRAVEQRENKRPIMSDLRDSGSIEQDADKILMLYRDDYYKSPEEPKDGMAQIFLRKNRNGKIGSVFMRFNGETSNFAE